MRTLTSVASLCMLATLAGCGSMSLESKRVDYGAAAVRAPSLEVPPDLTVPAPGERFMVPEDTEAGTSFSDYSKTAGTVTTTGAISVLPVLPNVKLEKNGTQRWLLIDAKAEDVWPQVKAFFPENGLPIKSESAQAGVLETEWVENRANLPKTGLRRIIGQVFDGIYDSGQKDSFRARLERSKDGNGTEIYLTHYGIEEILNSDKSESRWQQRPNDPELEATMLQMLALKLGGVESGETVVGAQYGKESIVEGVVPQLQSRADGSQYLVIAEPFDKSWRSVGLALESAKFAVTDKNRARGLYYIRADAPKAEKGLLEKLAFWRDDEPAAVGRYQVRVREVSAGCEVTVQAADEGAAEDADTNRIVDALYKALLGK